MSIIEPKKYETAIIEHRKIYSSMTDMEFIAYFAKKYPVVTEKQVALVLKHYTARADSVESK